MISALLIEIIHRASLSTQTRDLLTNEEVTIGFTLSDEIYTDINYISMENAI